VLGNTIEANGGAGVVISGGTGSDILSDAIFGNTGLAIDLGFNGATPNDTGDIDSGPNNYLNFPTITAAQQSAAAITIAGTYNGPANSTFTLDFYGSATTAGGRGQGQLLTGAITVHTDSSGNASFSATFAVTLPTGWVVSGIATDSNWDTSEFSPAVPWTAVTARRRR
jgi:hypothetical protein